MARFLYLVRNDGDCPTADLSPEEVQALIERYMGWIGRVQGEGRLHAAEKLADGTGRVVRKGKGIVKDGPFSETKEIVGGFWIVEAKDYDDAVALADGLPFGDGTLEIRQIDDSGG